MKKRFISKLLMAALVVVTMGVFSSCKDYDDDINANTALINQLQSQVDALKTANAKAQADATQALQNAATAQAAADKAQADLATAKSDLQKAINDAKTNLEGQIDAAKQAAITEAQARVDAAEARAKAYAQEVAKNEAAAAAATAKQEILAKLEADVNTLNNAINANKDALEASIKANKDAFDAYKEATDGKLSQIDAIIATLATKDEVNAALQPILGDIAALKDLVNTKADKTTVEAIQTRLDEIYNDYVHKADFESLKTAVALLGARMDAAEENINTLTGKVTTNAQNIQTNADNIAINSGAITALQQTVNQILVNYATIEYVDSKISALDDKLSAEIAKMALKTELQALEMKVDNAIATHATDKKAIDEAIAAINATIETLATKTELAEAKAELKADLDSQIAAVNTSLQNLAAALQEFKDNTYTKAETDANIAAAKEEALTKLSEAKLDLQLQINDLSSDVQNLQEALRVLTEVTLVKMNEDLLAAIGVVDTKVGNLDGKVDGINTDLNSKITNILTIIGTLASQEYVDGKIQDVNDKITALSTTMQTVYATIQSVNQLSGRVDGIDNRVTAIEGELAGMAAELSALADELGALDFDDIALARMGATATSGIQSLVKLLRTMSLKINEIYAYLDKLDVKIDNMESEFDNKINGVYNFFNTAIAAVTEKINNITLFIDKDLTSIVFRPSNVDGDDAWLYGFPKIDADIIAAQSTYTFAGQGKDATYTEAAIRSNEQSGYAFELTAQYWLNPSTVDWKNYTYSFDEIATKNVITRGNTDYQEAGFKEVRAEKYEKGVLTIKFKFDKGENVNNAETWYYRTGLVDGNFDEHWLSDNDYMDEPAYSLLPSYAWVTTVALQATRNNTETDNAAGLTNNRVVTSDYAIIAPTYINNLLLGNNAYAAKGHGVQGNQQYHLRTVFNDVKAEDALGAYSFELDLDDKNGLELNKYVDVHYNNCSVWANAVAQKKGFEFKYTLLVNGDVWNLDGDKISIKEGKGVSANTGNDKAAIIRVELIANGKTYAYGYISVLMKNKQTELEVEIPELVLNCDPVLTGDNGFVGTYSWAGFMAAIKEALGKDVDWALADFVPVTATDAAAPNAGPYKKFANKNGDAADNTSKGILAHVGDKLAWSFTKAEAEAAFYKDGAPANVKNYGTIIKIMPNANGVLQGVAPIVITVKIGKVTYPSGDFGNKDNRIQQMWFEEASATIAKTVADRYEIHANVETLGQNLAVEGVNTAIADDEFVFDISSTFVLNQFTITPDAGFTFGKDADVWFDASKYAKKNSWNNSHVYNGGTGAQYVLWLNGAYDRELKASPLVNGAVNFNDKQVVVKLQGAHNEIAIFQGYRDPVNSFYARDLLNHARHDQLGAGMTFTTHMIMHQIDYCLPIAERGDQTFDIRYLRPISAIANDTYTVYDAKNDGNEIWLADLVNFVDWRDHKFSSTGNATYNNQSTGKTGMTYMNYYGITTIKADFESAKTNINGGDMSNPSSWPLITDVTGKMKFTPDAMAAAGLGSAVTPTRTAQTFRIDNGYYLYENNAAGVGDFYIYLPISIVYDWGETQPEWIMIHVVKTQGQHNEGRQI
jgi:hypothetical protein